MTLNKISVLSGEVEGMLEDARENAVKDWRKKCEN
jgi:hypothetical protein